MGLWGSHGGNPGRDKGACQSKVVGAATREGDSPVDEGTAHSLMRVPKYDGARAIPLEAGGTTLQG